MHQGDARLVFFNASYHKEVGLKLLSEEGGACPSVGPAVSFN